MASESSRRASPLFVGVVVGVAALALYAATCCRGVCWQDSAVHQYRILTGQPENRYGLALSHPLHHWIGRGVAALTADNLPFALNLISSVFGAVAVALVAGLVAALTGRWLPAVLAALTTGLAHAFWQMSVLAETYTLEAALLAAEWCILLAYCRSGRAVWLVLLFGVNGLHVSNHLLGLLSLATYGVLLLERIWRGKVYPVMLLPIAVAWLAGASPYISLIAEHYQRVDDLNATLNSAFFGVGTMGTGFKRRVLNWRLSTTMVAKFVFFFAYSFPSAAIAIAAFGVARLPAGVPRPLFWVLAAQTAIYFVFVARYQIFDIYTFFLPMCALVGVWLGLGAAELLDRARGVAARRTIGGLLLANALLPVAVYILFPMLAERGHWLDAYWRDAPYRDEYSSFFHPWKHQDDSAERYARATLDRAQAGGLILADASSAYPIAILDWTPGRPSAKGVALYAGLDCVTRPQDQRLTPEVLRILLRAGRDVLVVPSPEIDLLWAKDFNIVKGGDWWRIELRPDDN